MNKAHARAQGRDRWLTRLPIVASGLCAVTLALAMAMVAMAQQTQDAKPDRPPWAQTEKATPATSNSTSADTASSNSGTAGGSTTSGTTGGANGGSGSTANPKPPASSSLQNAKPATPNNAATAKGAQSASAKTKLASSNRSIGNNAGVAPGPPVPIVEPSLDTSSTAAVPGQNANTSKGHAPISVTTSLVTLLASVLDENNRPAPDLPVDAFQVFEEGVPQRIAIFDAETSQPLDLALMIDASLSAHKEFSFEQEAAAHFIRQVLRPNDRLGVFAFDETVTQYAAFSENVPMLQAAVRKIPGGAGTSIYDALVFGSHELEKRGDERRRVIILVTDAGETTSRYDFDAARKAAVRSGALLYTIVIRPVKNENGRNTAGEHALETITDTTGGAMFYPDTPQELGVIFDLIDRELRTQYRLAYYPDPPSPPNAYRNIEVKVLGTYHVRHRKTYLSGPQ